MTVNKSDQRHAHVKQLLGKMDPEVAESFTYKQRKALQKAINTRDWNNHKIDFRPTLRCHFYPGAFILSFWAG